VRARLAALTACAALLGLALVLLRGEPRVWGDSGVFLTVAARLLEGDRLYAEVADNKDPLFYYSYAAALWVGGWKAPFALDGLWLAVGGIGIALLLRELRAGTAVVATGLLVYPLALTAAWYEPGASMLAGLALAPFPAWLWARERFIASGAVLGALVLFKANLGLVAGAPLLVLLALGSSARPRYRRVADAALGLALALGAAAAILAARGELRAYVEMLEYNTYYSDAGLRSQGGSGSFRNHLELAREVFRSSGRWQWPAVVTGAAALLATAAVFWRRGGAAFRALSGVAIAALLAAVVTLGMTALFREHLQMLAFPFALGAATFVAAASTFGRRAGPVAAAALVAFAAWSSLKHEDLGNPTLDQWTASQLSVPGEALERTRAGSFADGERVPYAVFGRNTEDGHAAFVGGELELACRWFHQYPFYRDEELSETLDCARTEEPMLVLVTQSFYDAMPNEPRWETFVADTRQLLAARYELVTELGMSQVWKRR